MLRERQKEERANLSGAEVNFLLTRPGSSAGKIGKTRIIGAKKVLKDFRRLTKTRQAFMRKYGKGDTKALQFVGIATPNECHMC